MKRIHDVDRGPWTPLQAPITNWTAFDPRAYLDEYYSDVGEENLAIMHFYADVFGNMSPKSTMLDFGSGPTIYSLISAVTKVRKIHVVEYLEANRRELRKWFLGDDTSFDWSHFIRAGNRKRRQRFNIRHPAAQTWCALP